MKDPRYAAQMAVEARWPVILVSAGPGSGKTSTIIARTIQLIKSGVRPEAIALVTFSCAAAAEMRNRLADLGCKGLGYVGTLHALALRIARAAEQEDLIPIDQQEAEQLLMQAAANAGIKVSKTALIEAAKSDQTSVTAAGVAVTMWRNYLRRNSLITFDDMLKRALAALKEPNEHVRRLIAWTDLLVDEYQDSSAIDDEIYSALPVPNKFFVGDIDQCIYTFRGADAGVMLRRARSTQPEAAVINLSVNHRSDGMICWAANNLIAHNKIRIPQKTLSESGERGIAIAVRHANEFDETRWLAQELRAQLAAGKSCAVLVRTNHLVGLMAEQLRSFGVQVAQRKRVDLPEDWTVAMLLARAVECPTNDYAALSFLETCHGIERASEIQTRALAAGRNLAEFAGLTAQKPADLLTLMASFNLSPRSIELARTAVESSETFADCITALREVGTSVETEGSGAVVSTIHAAKGHEYDCVYMPAFEDQIIPGTAGDEDLEEERRVAYVGITRARNELYISFACERTSHWPPRTPAKVEPSRFLAETGLPVTTPSLATEARAGTVSWAAIPWQEATVGKVEEVIERRREITRLAVRRYRERKSEPATA